MKQTGQSVRARVNVRNLRCGEAAFLPAALLNHGMPYLVEDWVWVVELDAPIAPVPFAIIITSFAHGWVVLWRVIALSPLPSAVPLTWFLKALPQVFAEVRLRGCVGFVTLLSDDQPAEVKMARIITRLARGGIMPFQGSIGAGMLMEFGEDEQATEITLPSEAPSAPPFALAAINSIPDLLAREA
jgi:hypothetical protein